jgi:hypothetical protein
MKKKLIPLIAIILSTLNQSFSQSCWKKISVKGINLTCDGGNDGAIELEWEVNPESTIHVATYLAVSGPKGVVDTGWVVNSFEKTIGNLMPGGYTVKFTQYYIEPGQTEGPVICITDRSATITSPGCNLSISNMKMNTDPSSEDFLQVKGNVTGSFCAGMGADFGSVVNDESTVTGSKGFKGYVRDSSITSDALQTVLPGDKIKFFVDNNNAHEIPDVSSTCRAFSPVSELPCDLGVAKFLAVQNSCGGATVQGQLITKYLKLIDNHSWFHGYAGDFFNVEIYNPSNELITTYKIPDSNGYFSINIDGGFQGIYTLKWKLGKCQYQQSFSIGPSPQNTAIFTGLYGSAWDNAANWNCGVIPDENSNVIINIGNAKLGQNARLRTLDLKPGTNFTVEAGFNLTILQQ